MRFMDAYLLSATVGCGLSFLVVNLGFSGKEGPGRTCVHSIEGKKKGNRIWTSYFPV